MLYLGHQRPNREATAGALWKSLQTAQVTWQALGLASMHPSAQPARAALVTVLRHLIEYILVPSDTGSTVKIETDRGEVVIRTHTCGAPESSGFEKGWDRRTRTWWGQDVRAMWAQSMCAYNRS